MEEEGLVTKLINSIPEYQEIRAEILEHKPNGHTLAVISKNTL